MTTRVNVLSALILALTGVAAGTLPAGTARADTATSREQSEARFDAAGITGLTVSNSRGLVTVTRSRDRAIHLTALKIARASDRQIASRSARETQVLSTVEDGRLMVRVRYPQRQAIRVNVWEMFRGFELPRVEVRLAIEIPEDLPVSLGSTSGDLETEDLSGDQRLENTSGDITVRGARGRLEASTTSGDISAIDIARARLSSVSGNLEADDVKGALKATSTSGEIVIGTATDTLALATVSGGIRVGTAPRGVRARTTSGEIVIRAASGLVKLETSSGDMTVGLVAPLSRAEVGSVSGNILALLAPGLDCALDVRSSNGTLDVGVPLAIRDVTRRSIIGRIRQGSIPVALRSSSGDIVVQTGGK